MLKGLVFLPGLILKNIIGVYNDMKKGLIFLSGQILRFSFGVNNQGIWKKTGDSSLDWLFIAVPAWPLITQLHRFLHGYFINPMRTIIQPATIATMIHMGIGRSANIYFGKWHSTEINEPTKNERDQIFHSCDNLYAILYYYSVFKNVVDFYIVKTTFIHSFEPY